MADHSPWDGGWETWQRRYDERLATLERHFGERVGAVELEVARHMAQCEERHKEIGRRFDHADNGRRDVFGEIKELRGQLAANHAQNVQALSTVQLGQSNQWVRIAAAVGATVLAAAAGYFFRGGGHP